MKVEANYIAYGSSVLVALPQEDPAANLLESPLYGAGSCSDLKKRCSPTALESNTELSSDGTLVVKNYDATAAGGITGVADGPDQSSGGVCYIWCSGQTAQSLTVGVLRPQLWPGFDFQPTANVKVAIGEKFSGLTATAFSDNLLKPSSFSVACSPNYDTLIFDFDVFTGVATINGINAFVLSNEGVVTVAPDEGLSSLIDDLGATTAQKVDSLQLDCTVYGHYDWIKVLGNGVNEPEISRALTITLADNNCWVSENVAVKVSPSSPAVTDPVGCRKLCRTSPTCTHYAMQHGACQIATGVCRQSQGCAEVSVITKVPGCGPDSTCFDLSNSISKHLNGKFCPTGQGSLISDHPVYVKKGTTFQDQLYMTAYDSNRDGSLTGNPEFVLKAASLDDVETSSMLELHGATIASFPASEGIIDSIFSQGAITKGISAYDAHAQATLKVGTKSCGPPNTTVDLDTEDYASLAIVLDDPLTDDPADYWLHPCECFSEAWGNNAPVTSESFADVPPGSNNAYVPNPILVVSGQFVCEKASLLSIEFLSNQDQGQDPTCARRCQATDGCTFFWDGKTHGDSTCRLYSDCTTLIRESGLQGTLSAMSTSKSCRIADPDKCWAITKRRGILDAGVEEDGVPCMHQNLLAQCDQKLLLGGVGVDKCGKCTYAALDSHKWMHKLALPQIFSHGQTVGVSCWDERFQGMGSQSKTSLTCVDGVWLGPEGKRGLGDFTCGACIQISSTPYRALDAISRQELYFSSRQIVSIMVDNVDGSTKMAALTDTGSLSSESEEGLFVLESPTGVSATLRQVRSVTSPSKCLQFDGTLELSECSDSTKQHIAPSSLPQLLYEKVKATAATKDLLGPSVKVSNTMSLKDLLFTGDCGDRQALQGFGFTDAAGGEFNMQGKCTPVTQLTKNATQTKNLGGALELAFTACGDTDKVSTEGMLVAMPFDGLTCSMSWPPQKQNSYDPDISTDCADRLFKGGDTTKENGEIADVTGYRVDNFVLVSLASSTEVAAVLVYSLEGNANMEVHYQLATNEPEYAVDYTKENEDTCAEGYTAILDSDLECAAAAVRLGIGYFGKYGGNYNPKGCYLYNREGVYFGVPSTAQFTSDKGVWRVCEKASFSSSPGGPTSQTSFQYACSFAEVSSAQTAVQGQMCSTGFPSEPVSAIVIIKNFPTSYIGSPGNYQDTWGPAGVRIMKNMISQPEVMYKFNKGAWTSMAKLDVQQEVLKQTLRYDEPFESMEFSLRSVIEGHGKGALLRVLDVTYGDLCMTFNDRTDDVKMTKCSDSNQQKWFLYNNKLMNRYSAKCLMWATGKDAHNIFMAECDDSTNQQWEFHSDQTIRLKSDSSYCIDMDLSSDGHLGSTADARNIQSWKCNYWLNQRFYFDGEVTRGWKMCELKVSGDQLPTDNLEVNMPELPCWIKDYQERWMSCQKPSVKITGTRYINELVANPVKCSKGQAIVKLQKTANSWVYECAFLAGMGPCNAQQYSEQIDTSSGKLSSLMDTSIACGENQVLQQFGAEASSQGRWLRFTYTCCLVGGVPVAIQPKPGQFFTGGEVPIQSDEGIYCPIGMDQESGRLEFTQKQTGSYHSLVEEAAGGAGQSSLKFDMKQESWCLGDQCKEGSFEHPLDGALSFGGLQVVGMEDFDGDFVAKGVAKSSTRKPRPMPKLLTFKAQADYSAECRDEVTPGTKTFNLKTMNEEALALPDYNVCKNIGGKWKSGPVIDKATGKMTEEADEDYEGMAWTQGSYEKDDGKKGAGTTPQVVKDCASREISRDLVEARFNRDHDIAGLAAEGVENIITPFCNGLPATVIAPFGFGIMEDFENICEDIVGDIFSWINIANDGVLVGKEWNHANMDNADCNSFQQGFARIFCDLHCLRDAVRSGDAAILSGLGGVVDTVSKNNQVMLDYYIGEVNDRLDALSPSSTGGSLQQMHQKVHSGIMSMLVDMEEITSTRGFDPAGQATAKRALDTFHNSLKEKPVWANATARLPEVLAHAQKVHSTFRMAAKAKGDISHEEEVQANIMVEVTALQKVLRTKNMLLGVYADKSISLKQRQNRLRSVARDAARPLVMQLDKHWWALRSIVDEYLDAANAQVTGYTQAFEAVRSYTSECSGGFSALQQSYMSALRSEETALRTLKKGWRDAVSRFGLLAAHVCDTDMFVAFADEDLASIDIELLKNTTAGKQYVRSLCNASSETEAKSSANKIARDTFQKGLVGQTMRQLRAALLEVSMLRARHRQSELGEPSQSKVLDASWERVRSAHAQIMQNLPAVSEVREKVCHVRAALRGMNT
jgi:hypothetical protein